MLLTHSGRSFKAGQYTLDELVRKASEVDFAAFILGQEDKTISRGKVKPSPRDNVIFEAGLFAGKLGISNVFLIVDEKGSKLPSDINGLVYVTYNSETQKISDAIKRAGMTIRSQVKSWSQEQKRTLKQQIIGKWWQYVLNSDVGAVVSLMNIEFDKDEPGFKIDGQSWSLENKKVARYQSRAVTLDKSDKRLFYYWEGLHPFDKEIDQYYGVGQIDFKETSGDKIKQGMGWFTQQAQMNDEQPTKKSFQLLRAEEQDCKILLNGKVNEREKLIKSLLNSRNQLKL